MTNKQTMIAFAGLALIAFHFWFGRQKPALSPLWGGHDPNAAVPKGTAQLLLPGTLFGLPGSPQTGTNGATNWFDAYTGPLTGKTNPAPVIAPSQAPSLPYGPYSGSGSGTSTGTADPLNPLGLK